MKYGKHVALQEKAMWIGLEVSAFGYDLVINGVPNSIHVPYFVFGDVVPPWTEYNI